MQLKTLAVAVLVAAAGAAEAQDDSRRLVDNPFQEGLRYAVGDELELDVDIQGVWWTLMQIAPVTEGSGGSGADVEVTARVEFDNRAGRGVRLTVVLMLEDADERPLDRLQLPSFKLPARRVREHRHRFSVAAEDLLATRRVYLFCQVE